MSSQLIGIIGVVLLVILLFTRMWVAMTMFVIGFAGCWILSGFNTALSVIGTVPYSQSMNYTMACLPLFVLMGVVLAKSGLGGDLYNFASKILGRIQGGLAMATVLACAFFAAVCGDSVTTAVTMGKVSYPEMKRHNYSERIATGCIVAGGTIGVLIPPSICFIIYGLITQQSIGALFMAGMIPGILQAVFYILTIFIVCKTKPNTAPAGMPVPIKEKVRSAKTVWPVLVIFVLIMYGMYGGWFTPTEGGAFGAFVAIVISFINRRLTPKTWYETLKEAALNTAMIYFLIVSCYVFLRFMALSELPAAFSRFVTRLNTEHNVPGFVIMTAIVVMYIVLGCFIDVMAAILLTISILYPVVLNLGYSPIWFGVIVVRLMEIGMVTPPFGLNLFAIAKTTKAPMGTVYRGVIPFLAADVVHIALLIAVPQLSLWLPGMM
ncbi:MAG: TRAP transporter large permease [Oscillospiraceae bacterium]|nr:TRAP transporter large permease [Oscillospiraceae bacterium]